MKAFEDSMNFGGKARNSLVAENICCKSNDMEKLKVVLDPNFRGIPCLFDVSRMSERVFAWGIHGEFVRSYDSRDAW